MRVSEGFKSLVLDGLEELGDTTARAMFGGVGLYCGGVFFGLIASDVLYLKVGEENRPDFERAGSKPFRPYAHRSGTMQYWAVPIDVLENVPELVRWARKAVGVATQAQTPAARPTKKSSRSPR
jgi:DNA transformation protein